MSSHKFKIGQMVRFRPGRMVGYSECKILRLLPIEEGNHLYRIKCATENVERVAKESELASSDQSLDQSGHSKHRTSHLTQPTRSGPSNELMSTSRGEHATRGGRHH